MKKSITIFLLFLLSNINLFSLPLNDLIHNNPFIEFVENTDSNLITRNGALYLKGAIEFPDGSSVSVVFWVDTGAQKSCLFRNNFDDIESYFDYHNEKYDCGLVNATVGTLKIKDWYLFAEKSVLPNDYRHGFETEKYFAILGNDVLMKKSFYISATKNEIMWTDDNPFIDNQDVIKFKAYANRQNVLKSSFYTYDIFIENDFFASPKDGNGMFFYSPDGNLHRWKIDTGTYKCMVNQETFEYQIKNNGYENYVYKSDDKKISNIGFCKIPNTRLFYRDFENLSVLSGVVSPIFKCMGLQILSAFDIYFEVGESGKVENIYFSPVEEDLYKKYRKQNDNECYISDYTYGFFTNSTGVVVQKAFYQGKEILRKIKIGDKVISINDLPYNTMRLWDFPEKAIIKMQRPNGKFYTVKADRFCLNKME